MLPPYVKPDIERLEMVQRRTNAIVTMFYKIINNLISIDFPHDLRPVMSSTQGYLKDLSVYHLFLPHSIPLWNSLPETLITAPDLNSFCRLT